MATVWRVSSIVILLLISGCSVQKRAIKRVKWVDDRHPMTLVRWCADNVPVRADTEYIPGRPIVIPGVIKYVDCDSIRKSVDSTHGITGSKVAVPCPPSTHTVDTMRETLIDSASLMVIRHEKDSMHAQVISIENDLNRAKGAKNTFMWLAIVSGALLVVMAYLWGKGRLL